MLAAGFMVVMALTGKLSETRQLAKFEARGVLSVLPEQVRQVDCALVPIPPPLYGLPRVPGAQRQPGA